MDDLYGNLDNYNEENRISELQAENKELKCRLENYTATLSQVQKDFDMLSSEYKKLETNYSSLLKTAKAEIERKTQIITNLNKEKDNMVILFHQNKGTRPGQARGINDSLVSQNKMDAQTKPERDNKPRQSDSSRKQSPHVSTERKEQGSLPSSSNPRSKCINVPNSQHDTRSEKNIKCKENIQDRTVPGNPSAPIRNRRKSMPAISFEKDQFSPDEDDAGGVTTKHETFHHKQKHTDYNLHERPKSRISETSSLEERKQNQYYETESLSHKRRSSKYDREPDRYRTRHKSSSRYKRRSSERHPSGPRDYYHKSQPDTHRSRGNDLETRLPHHSQERHGTKRRTEHGFDEADCKRARLEPLYRHHEVDRRMEDNRKHTHDKYITDPPNIQFSSCESPDYDNLEITQQQVREIKLTATTKLVDPRISSHKYALENDNGKPILRTIAGQDVDIVPLNPIAWGINTVSMPQALVKMPTVETSPSVGDFCKNIENPADISMESGEIVEHEDAPSHENLYNERKFNIQSNERKKLPVPVPKVNDIKNMEESIEKINSYKIPKLIKCADDKNNQQNSSKTDGCDNSSFKKDFNYVKNLDVEKQLLCLAKGKKLNKGHVLNRNSQLPLSGHSEHRTLSAQEVVEGDLEMSDDNCDEEHSHKILKEAASDNSKTPCVDSAKELPIVLEPAQPEEPGHQKTKTKKKSKQKEPKCSKIVEFGKPAKTKLITSTLIKSKFSELFDDSSSLINPEDLGVESIPVTTTRLPDKCIPFFEDAVNVVDLNTVEPTSENDLVPPAELEKNDSQCDQVLCDPGIQEPNDKIVTNTNAITDEDIASIYKNLEPGVPEQEDVQTVVISTGVQPPVLAAEEEQLVTGKPNDEKEKATTQYIALEALATSTPHKPLQQNTVPADTVVKQCDSACNPSNGIQKVTVDNQVTDRSDNTIDSQTGDEPDVRIFVKRRRRKGTKK